MVMRDYVKQLVNGGVHYCIETDQPGIDWIFNGPDFDETIPFEGNSREVYEEPDGFLHEAYWPNSNDNEIYIQTNELPDGNIVIVFNNHGKKTYQYVEKQSDDKFDVFEYLNDEIKAMVAQAESNGSTFKPWLGQCAIQPTIYKLKDAWLISNFEIVYGKHANSIDIIADDIARAKDIETRLFERMRAQPISHRSRLERFIFNKDFDKYNGSEECNRLRHKYLQIIKRAYETFDFSEIFEYLDDGCIWGPAKGKFAVIENLKRSSVEMKKNNYLHKCTIVQVGRPVAPLECNTKPDGSGEKCFVGLLYHQGELCMVDVTPRQTLFFRMDLSPNGKIHSYYATLPSGDFHPIDDVPVENV